MYSRRCGVSAGSRKQAVFAIGAVQAPLVASTGPPPPADSGRYSCRKFASSQPSPSSSPWIWARIVPFNEKPSSGVSVTSAQLKIALT